MDSALKALLLSLAAMWEASHRPRDVPFVTAFQDALRHRLEALQAEAEVLVVRRDLGSLLGPVESFVGGIESRVRAPSDPPVASSGTEEATVVDEPNPSSWERAAALQEAQPRSLPEFRDSSEAESEMPPASAGKVEAREDAVYASPRPTASRNPTAETTIISGATIGISAKATPNQVQRLEGKLAQAGLPPLSQWLETILPGARKEDLTRQQLAALTSRLNETRAPRP